MERRQEGDLAGRSPFLAPSEKRELVLLTFQRRYLKRGGFGHLVFLVLLVIYTDPPIPGDFAPWEKKAKRAN